MTTSLIDSAHRIADTVLFPAALEVDRTGSVPETHWNALADAGLYSIAAPVEFGGPGLPFGGLIEILEILAGGWRLAGHAPFVSGWGVVDVIQFSAGDVETGDIVAGLVAARDQPGFTVIRPQDLFVADASRTVSLDVDGLVIADERIVSRVSRAEFMATQNVGSRLNATLPIGVAGRCVRVLDEAGESDAAAALRATADDVSARLDAGLADAATLLQARADGCELAVRAASAVVAVCGGPALLRSAYPQLLARWAAFTLVAASRPDLKRALVGRLSR